MGLRTFRSLVIAIAVLISVIPGSSVHGQTQPADGDDVLRAGLRELREIADIYRWSIIKGAEHRFSFVPNGGKVLTRQENKFELTRAGDVFRLINDENFLTDPAHPTSVLGKFTFDGKVVRRIGTYRNPPSPPNYFIGPPDLDFMDVFDFWVLMGLYNYNPGVQLADHLQSTYSAQKEGNLSAQWLNDGRGEIEIYGSDKVGNWERTTIDIRNKFVRKHEAYVKLQGITGLTEVTATQMHDGRVVPKEVTWKAQSTGNSSNCTYDFSEFRLLAPAEVNAAEITMLTPEPGTKIVDMLNHVAYHITANGKEYLPLYDPVTGKVTEGPATEPSSVVAVVDSPQSITQNGGRTGLVIGGIFVCAVSLLTGWLLLRGGKRAA